MKQTAHKAQLANDKVLERLEDLRPTATTQEWDSFIEVEEFIKQSLTQNSERNTLGEFKTQNTSEEVDSLFLDKLYYKNGNDYYEARELVLNHPCITWNEEETKTPSPNKLEQEQLRDEIIEELNKTEGDDRWLYNSEENQFENDTDNEYIFIDENGDFMVELDLPLELAHKITTYFMRSE